MRAASGTPAYQQHYARYAAMRTEARALVQRYNGIASGKNAWPRGLLLPSYLKGAVTVRVRAIAIQA